MQGTRSALVLPLRWHGEAKLGLVLIELRVDDAEDEMTDAVSGNFMVQNVSACGAAEQLVVWWSSADTRGRPLYVLENGK